MNHFHSTSVPASAHVNRRSRRAQAALILGAVGAYGLAFFPVYRLLGPSAVSLAMLPVAVAAWRLGTWGGLLSALFCLPLNALLLNLVGQPGWEVMTRTGGGLLGAITLVLGAGIVGRISDLGKRAVRELAERVRAEAALREERQLFIGGTTVIFKWKAAAGWPVEYVSPNVRNQFGYRPEELVCDEFRYAAIVRSDDLARVAEEVKAYTQAGVPCFEQEYRIMRADGEYRWVYDFTVPVRDDAGAVTHYHGYVQDITERKQAEADLQRLSHQNRLILDSLGEGVYGVDLDGRATFLNPAAAEMLGYQVHELIGQPMHEMIHHSKPDGSPHPQEACLIYAAFRDGAAHHTADEVFWRKDGRAFSVEYVGTPIRENGALAGAVVVFTDITERKRAEEERARLLEQQQRHVERLAVLYETARATTDVQDLPQLLDRALERILTHLPADAASVYLREKGSDGLALAAQRGFSPDNVDFFGRHRVGDPTVTGQVAARGEPALIEDVATFPYSPEARRLVQQEGVQSHAAVPLRTGASVVGVLNMVWRRRQCLDAEARSLLEGLADILASGVLNARLLEETLRRAAELEALADISTALRAAPNLDELVPLLVQKAAEVVGGTGGSIFLVEPETGDLVSRGWYSADAERGARLVDEGSLRHRPGEGATGHVAASGEIYMTQDLWHDPVAVILPGEAERLGDVRSGISLPLRAEERIIGVLHIWWREQRTFAETETRLLTAIAEMAGNAIHRAALHEQTQRRANEFAALYEITRDLAAAWDLPALLQTIVERATRLLAVPGGGIYLHDAARGDLQLAVTQGLPLAPGVRLRLGEGMAGRVAQTCQPLIVDDYRTWEHRSPQYEEIPFTAVVQVPMLYAGELIGVLAVHEIGATARKFTQADARLLALLAAQAASAVRNARLFEETSRRLEHITALHAVDMAITASPDLPLTLDVLLNHVTAQLRVDAADILLLNPHSQTLEYAAGHGFRTAALQHTRLQLGEGHAGRAALERRTIGIPDLRQRRTDFLRSPSFAQEAFITAYAVPLIAKGQVQGVLEIFHRAPLHPDHEWLDFLETLAGQAAIAIENASLFDSLQRSNVELALAYDATIEGWSRALDLRERETERHTQRVTEMALKLARAMGFSEAELVHVRRGALLHDIGKMGVPDIILLKPSPLTDEEWEIMRQHPQYAYDMLSPIAYLRPALDIPHCHHEKWDGTGYPRGLKGEQIPLAARIFAVADVWDALRSDRPYGRAWPEEKVCEYIHKQAGKHFEPQVVETFFRVIGENYPAERGERT